MKVQFIVPPETHSIESSVPKQLEGGKGFYPKLGLLSVAAHLERVGGYPTASIDCPADRIDYPELERRLRADPPDLVGISTLTFNLIDTMLTVRAVKRAAPRAQICMGGQHVNLYPRETLGLDGIDFVIAGEGERSFTQLVQALDQGAGPERLDAIPGLGWKDGALHLSPQRDTITQLDQLPFPARHLIELDHYSHMIGKGKRIATLQSSRGCPAACTFCDIRKTRFRERSPENVRQEILELVELGVDDLFFVDDTITINKKRMLALCDLLTTRGPKINFKISARVDTVNPELLAALKRAGCYRIHYGVESATQRLLDYMEKGSNLNKIRRAFQWTREAGIGSFAYMMIGIPSETYAEMMASVDLAIELDPDYAQFSICTPYPKTELYFRMLKDGHVPYDYWQSFSENPTEDFRVRFWNRDFSEDQLREIQAECHQRFYSRFKVLAREALRVRSVGHLLSKVQIGTNILLKRINA
ncbi:MAG TPA: radical SAM protein [Acidobacteriota bacterium]